MPTLSHEARGRKVTVKGWIAVDTKSKGNVWTVNAPICATKRSAQQAFAADTQESWESWSRWGWRIVPCTITYDDGKPRASRGGGK